MKIIKCLSDFIEEELDGAKTYIEKALKYKEKDMRLAETFYTISLEEMKHVDLLHGEVVRLIEEERKEHGEPPENMMFLYEYLHEKHIECAKEIKVM